MKALKNTWMKQQTISWSVKSSNKYFCNAQYISGTILDIEHNTMRSKTSGNLYSSFKQGFKIPWTRVSHVGGTESHWRTMDEVECYE